MYVALGLLLIPSCNKSHDDFLIILQEIKIDLSSHKRATYSNINSYSIQNLHTKDIFCALSCIRKVLPSNCPGSVLLSIPLQFVHGVYLYLPTYRRSLDVQRIYQAFYCRNQDTSVQRKLLNVNT